MTESRRGVGRPSLRVVAGETGDARRDDELARALLSGDEAAFGELVRRHEERVYAIARRYADGPDDAADLAQRVFLRAFRAVRRSFVLRATGARFPLRAWLLRIAVNLGKNHARDRRRWRRAPLEAIDAQTQVAPEGPEAVELAERRRMVREAVLGLSRRQREVLTLRVDAELPFAEIAEVLGITENNAKVHFHHAARRLAELVAGRAER